MTGGPENYVDYRGLAEIMAVSVPTLKRWRKAGMPSVKFSPGARRFLPSECIEWAQGRSDG